MRHVDVVRTTSLSPDEVYARLSEHESLGPLFGARITRVRDGDTSRNGTGSVRRVRVWPFPAFEETITDAVPGRLIEYRITRGSPLRDHVGRIEITPADTGSRVHYVIDFAGAVPVVGGVVARLVGASLRRSVPREVDVLLS